MQTHGAPVFDIVFVLEKPITDPLEREKLLTNLVKAIPQCDPSACYEDEIIEPYKVQKVVVCNLNAKVNSLH